MQECSSKYLLHSKAAFLPPRGRTDQRELNWCEAAAHSGGSRSDRAHFTFLFSRTGVGKKESDTGRSHWHEHSQKSRSRVLFSPILAYLCVSCPRYRRPRCPLSREFFADAVSQTLRDEWIPFWKFILNSSPEVRNGSTRCFVGPVANSMISRENTAQTRQPQQENQAHADVPNDNAWARSLR